MTIGVASYSQAAALKTPIQSNVTFEQQNTREQRAIANTAQPREAEIAESISADNDRATSFRQEREDEFQYQNSGDRGSNVDIIV